MALGPFPLFSKSRHRLASPSSDAQPSTPFRRPAIRASPATPCDREAGMGANPLWRQHSGWSACPGRACVRSSKRAQGETQLCSQDRPREGQEGSEPERHSQSWRAGVQNGESTCRFWKRRLSIRPRSDVGSGAGGETDLPDPPQP